MNHLWIRAVPLCTVAERPAAPAAGDDPDKCRTCTAQAALEFFRMAVAPLGAVWSDECPTEQIAARAVADVAARGAKC